MLSIEVNKDGSALGDILFNEGLNWPSIESEVLSTDGFFNSLTEEQAIEVSKALEQFLPKFTMPEEAQA